jgi:hypothetical protein
MQGLFRGRHCITGPDICESHASAHSHCLNAALFCESERKGPYRGSLRRAAATMSHIRISYAHPYMMTSTKIWMDSCASALLLDPHETEYRSIRIHKANAIEPRV